MPVRAASVKFFVPGRPEPQGSKSVGKYGQIYEQGAKKLKPWRDAVRIAARAATHNRGGPFEGAIELYLEFRFLRPASHLKKNGSLRKGAPTMHVFKPDVDKLTRAILDALSRELYDDDRQIVGVYSSKVWTFIKALEGVQILAVEIRSESEVLPPEDTLD